MFDPNGTTDQLNYPPQYPPLFPTAPPPPKKSKAKFWVIGVIVTVVALGGIGVAIDRKPVHGTGTVAVAPVVQAPASFPAPDPTTETSDPSDDLPSSDDSDSLYLAVLRSSRYSDDYMVDDTETMLIKIGHQVCSTFDAGASFRDTVEAVETGFSPGASGYLIGAAVGAYCPEYRDLITG